MYKEKWHVFHAEDTFFGDSKRVARELLFPTTEVNQSVPLGCDEGMSFLVDTSKLRFAEDITCDDNGKYAKCSRSKYSITLDSDNNITSEGKGRKGTTYTCVRKYYKHRDTPTFQRTIYELQGEEAVHPVCLIRYEWKGERTELLLSPHGNQKKSDRPYIRAKKELIEDIKNTKFSSGRKIMSEMYEKQGGIDTQSFSSIPRDTRQIYRHTAVKGSKSDFSELLKMNLSGEFVKSVEFSHVKNKGAMPRCVLFTEQQIKDLRRNCCRNNKVLMFDATFDLGPMYLTISSYRHDYFRNKINGLPVLMPGPMLLHSQKDEDSYGYFGTEISKAIDANVNLFGTDGEVALYKGLQGSASFRKSEHLMCMLHHRSNCEKKLADLGVKKNVRRIVRSIYGEQVEETRYEGLVDALTEEEYEAKLATWIPQWDALEHEESGKESQFSTWFLRYKSADVRKCMLATLRKKAGLGDPPAQFTTNDAEAINAMVARWIGGKKGWDQLAKSLQDFVRTRYQELEMAVIGIGDREVNPACENLQKTPIEWRKMCRQEKDEVLEQAHLLDTTKSLSISAEESGVCGYTSSELEDVWNKAETILGSSKNVVEFPNDPNSTICFSRDTHFTVKRTTGNRFTCDSQCRSYVFLEHQFCEHTIAVAEWRGCLADFLVAINTKAKKSSSVSLLNKVLDRQCSQSGKKKVTKRKGANNRIGCPITKVVRAPFSPQPFTVARKIGLISRCYGCKRNFDDDMNVPPRDLILRKMDLREWVDRNTGELKRSTHLVPTYYHLSIDCVRITYPVTQIRDILLHGEVKRQLTEQHLRRLEQCGINTD